MEDREEQLQALVGRHRRLLRRLLSLEFGVLLGLLTMLLALVVFFAQYSGIVRWALLILLVGLGAWLAGKFVYLQVDSVRPLGPRGGGPGTRGGGLTRLATTLRRARSGLRYSQIAFLVELRDAFLEKVRAETGFEGEPRDLLDRPALLRAAVDDADLYDFVVWVTELERSLADILGTQEEVFPGEPAAFPAEAERILRRMEAWP